MKWGGRGKEGMELAKALVLFGECSYSNHRWGGCSGPALVQSAGWDHSELLILTQPRNRSEQTLFTSQYNRRTIFYVQKRFFSYLKS